uniref:NADH-ubiquinone oxidoreductase chain 4 n=1 Tax=Dermanyssus gallinae TaxID=34641 RepID=A0A7U3Q036_9ACAR|nr:NADH dehydrogenase subunit 4 [Dermanyssus gallinae]QPG86046.1 NADH dehydrogenase subunit 4 [Dermanyssus gallinae]
MMMVFYLFGVIIISFFIKIEVMVFLLMFLLGLLMKYFGSIQIYNYMYMDNMSIMLTLLTIWIIIMMMMVSLSLYKKSMEYKFMLNMILFILIMLFCSVNMIMFFMFFEMILLPMFYMIMIWGMQKERSISTMYMMLYTMVGSLPLLFFFLKISIYKNLSFIMLMYDSVYINNMYIYMCMLLVFLVKLPIYGLHLWLPKAHVEAPVMGSMILAGVILKMGGFGLYRLVYMFDINMMMQINWILYSLSLLGSFYIGMICLMMVDVKMMIAYSSVCHMGYIIMGILGMHSIGLTGALMMMIGHGLCSSALFVLVNFFYERYHTRNMFMLKGLINLYPGMWFWWFIFCMINMSVPPFMNIFAEIMLIMVTIKWCLYYMMISVLIFMVCSLYSLYLYMMLFHGKFMFLTAMYNIYIREYIIMYMHIIPLMLYLLKMNMFML